MVDEPENLGDRLRRMERRLAYLDGQVEHVTVTAALFDAMAEYVIMPSILLLSGHGHHDQLVAMLQRARDEVERAPHLDEELQLAAVEQIESWERWIAAIPRWSPPSYEERSPDPPE